MPSFSYDELTLYYKKLASLNVSPDDGCYPLGSCTMKYNPHANNTFAKRRRHQMCALIRHFWLHSQEHHFWQKGIMDQPSRSKKQGPHIIGFRAYWINWTAYLLHSPTQQASMIFFYKLTDLWMNYRKKLLLKTFKLGLMSPIACAQKKITIFLKSHSRISMKMIQSRN